MIQSKLFNSNFNESDAIKLLENLGYTIIAPEKIQKCNQSIIDFYNKSLIKYHADLGKTFIVDPLQDKKDLFALKRFHDKGKHLGQSINKLNDYLYTTLDYLFANLNDLKFVPPGTLANLLSSKYSWMLFKVKTLQDNKKSKALEKLKETIYTSDDDVLINLRKEREQKILKRTNGKEKETRRK